MPQDLLAQQFSTTETPLSNNLESVNNLEHLRSIIQDSLSSKTEIITRNDTAESVVLCTGT